MSKNVSSTPLGINLLSSLLQNDGLKLNVNVERYIGTSKNNSDYTPGFLIENTVLKYITYAIHSGYVNGLLTTANYNNLISIGAGTIPALGNAKSPGYQLVDPSGAWTNEALNLVGNQGPATTGYGLSGNVWQGQGASWFPYDLTNINSSITQWGFLRCFALQAYNEFNYNGITKQQFKAIGSISNTSMTISSVSSGTIIPGCWIESTVFNQRTIIVRQTSGIPGGVGSYEISPSQSVGLSVGITGYILDTSQEPQLQDFLASFNAVEGIVDQINSTIYTLKYAQEFLKGVYSNTNDLITADVSGVSLAPKAFGADLIALGKAINLAYISTFGLPSNLLKTIYENNAANDDLVLALMATGLTDPEVTDILENIVIPTVEQEQKIYSAFLVIAGDSLRQILIPLNCRTPNLNTLADLLDLKKLFPTSYKTLTVPIYNTSPGPTNSKTYYPIYTNDSVNTSLRNQSIKDTTDTQNIQGSPTVNLTSNSSAISNISSNINVTTTNVTAVNVRVEEKPEIITIKPTVTTPVVPIKTYVGPAPDQREER